MPAIAQRSGHPSPASPSTYRRRRPETTLLYGVINEHREAFLGQARERSAKGLPRYVTSELHAYLRCGILAHGFLHARCKDCHREMVVAFSCKRRGACPSCNVRRMCSTAAHLTDKVLPAVPIRQWVMSTPYELRLLLARRADAFGALVRIFAQEVMRPALHQSRGGHGHRPRNPPAPRAWHERTCTRPAHRPTNAELTDLPPPDW